MMFVSQESVGLLRWKIKDWKKCQVSSNEMTKVQLLTKKSKILMKTVSICTIDPNEISERFASNVDKACERFDPTNFLVFLCYFGSTTDIPSLFLNCKSSIRFDELLSNERIFTCEAFYFRKWGKKYLKEGLSKIVFYNLGQFWNTTSDCVVVIVKSWARANCDIVYQFNFL